MTAERTAIDPDAVQRIASSPATSVWVAASAGSGKTKVLTDRVLRLMLDGTPPQRILCLTFTKAAAAEMANRIHASLGRWTTQSETDLIRDLKQLTGETADSTTIVAARRLFARVLDVPGGLKIQTIHSFCESLLGRFPVEARVPPHFQVMDERSAAELLRASRDAVLSDISGDDDLAAALATIVGYLREEDFAALMGNLSAERGRLAQAIEGNGGVGALIDTVFARLGADPAARDSDIVGAASRDDAVDRDGLDQAAAALSTGTEKTDQPRGAILRQWLSAAPAARQASFEDYAGLFLTQNDEPRKILATKGVLSAAPQVGDILATEQDRLLDVCNRRRAAQTARATGALLQLGAAILAVYARAKAARVQLDYDDLIYKARDLLRTERDGFAAWVLFKLDGGLDHILIDEAQDTNPEQWEVVAALAEEFFAGQGARDVARTIFAVGDAKQSIFSFQRADPAAFRAYRDHFGGRVTAAEKDWKPVDLEISFRSTNAVLRAVDAVFQADPARRGVVEEEGVLRHFPFRSGHEGLVELWPAIGPAEDAALDWELPVRRHVFLAPERRLATVLARKIAEWIGRETLPSRHRPVRAGDVMILLRRRGAVMEELVRALKAAGVPVAGVDRMVLTEQLAVMDLIALGRFLLLPEDDLTLATVLKGPLIGFDENTLFRLCYARGDKSVWQRLADLAGTAPEFAAARAWLEGLLARTDYLPPFEMFAGILADRAALGPMSGWQRLIARLGPDAEDPVDEFLAQALAYERTHAPSLQGFLHWIEAGATEIKRDLEQGDRDEVRVMTVHGAKGLQAPIVILPDTMSKPQGSRGVLWGDGVPFWVPRQDLEDEVCRDLRAGEVRRRDEEYRRLLYVAMTRAEDRLYVCGWHGRQKPAVDCWYNLVRAGLQEVADPTVFDFGSIGPAGWSGDGWRLAESQTAAPKADDKVGDGQVPPRTEEWMMQPPAPEPAPPRPLAPSRPALLDPPTVSPLADGKEDRFQRGLLIHRLLQVLPDMPADGRPAACRSYLSRPAHGLPEATQAEIAAEVLDILESPEFEVIFAADSRAEVPVIGTVSGPDGPEVVSGQVDRLVVRDDEILVLDYKTNRPPPEYATETAPAYLRQMAAYRAVLRGIWPDRPVRCALLWTAEPRLMVLDDVLLDPYRVGP